MSLPQLAVQLCVCSWGWGGSGGTAQLSASSVLPANSICALPPLQPLWRFVDDVQDERLLVYRSEDIKDFSRLQSPKVCGYLKLDEEELLPEGLEDRQQHEGELSVCLGQHLLRGTQEQLCTLSSVQQDLVGLRAHSESPS